jgi:REP element-mobilizing transposase RayT
MERKVPFAEKEIYHLYTRGVEKRDVFKEQTDYDRFMLLLMLCNSNEPVIFGNLRKKYRGFPSIQMLEQERSKDTLTDIIAYALMPNHLHLIVRERQAGGISKFMLKLMTAYSMYFNTKYERSGPLFTRPFRSQHIDTDGYFEWAFAYVLLNPLELFQKEWKERGLANSRDAAHFMYTYRYGSFCDYFGKVRPEKCILSREALPVEVSDLRNIDDLLAALSRDAESYQEKSFGEPVKVPALV